MNSRRIGRSPDSTSLAITHDGIARLSIADGVSRDELIELITHLAFYAGWPAANTAVTIVRRVFEEIGAPKTERT